MAERYERPGFHHGPGFEPRLLHIFGKKWEFSEKISPRTDLATRATAPGESPAAVYAQYAEY